VDSFLVFLPSLFLSTVVDRVVLSAAVVAPLLVGFAVVKGAQTCLAHLPRFRSAGASIRVVRVFGANVCIRTGEKEKEKEKEKEAEKYAKNSTD